MSVDALKNLVRGMMDILILWLLFKRPMHGYGIISKIENITGLRFTPGAVYPLLYKMEKSGLIRGRWKKMGEKQRVKLYKITHKGINVLDDLCNRLHVFLRELQGRRKNEGFASH